MFLQSDTNAAAQSIALNAQTIVLDADQGELHSRVIREFHESIALLFFYHPRCSQAS